MKIQLTGKSFRLVEAGLNTLKIVEAKAVPSGKPQGIEFTFEDINGTQMKASYKFNNDKAMYVLSLIIRAFFGNINEFDTNMIGDLVGEFIDVEVKHTEKESTKRAGEKVVFANISKIIGKTNWKGREPWGSVLDIEVDYDFDEADTVEMNDEDLPF